MREEGKAPRGTCRLYFVFGGARTLWMASRLFGHVIIKLPPLCRILELRDLSLPSWRMASYSAHQSIQESRHPPTSMWRLCGAMLHQPWNARHSMSKKATRLQDKRAERLGDLSLLNDLCWDPTSSNLEGRRLFARWKGHLDKRLEDAGRLDGNGWCWC